MKSKTSFCNKTIVKKDLTRLWPVWVVPAIVFQVVYGLLLLSKYSYTGYNYSEDQIKELLCSQVASTMSNAVMICLLCGSAIVCAVLVFQYLNRSNSAFMVHSFPITRTCLFFSHAISGYLMLLIPFVLLYITTALFCLIGHIPMGLALLSYFLEMLFASIFFYCLALFLTMLSGNSVMSIVMYSVVQFFVYMVTNLLQMVIGYFSYGTHEYSSTQGMDRIVEWMTPVMKMCKLFALQISSDVLINETNFVADQFFVSIIARFSLYLIPAAGLLFLAVWLYKKRRMERVGETLVFPWSKIIFRFVFCLCASLLFVIVIYFLGFALLAMNQTYDSFYLCALVLLVLGTILSYIVCDMILEKTFHVFKELSWHMVLLFCLVIGTIFVGDHYLLCQRGQVDPDQIQKVSVKTDRGNDASLDASDEIRQVIAFEQKINQWAKKKSIGDLDEAASYITITYYYKDGGSAKHDYSFQVNENKDEAKKLLTMLNEKKGIVKRYGLENIDADDLSNVYVIDNTSEESYSVSLKYQEELYDALLKDLNAGNITMADFLDPQKTEQQLSTMNNRQNVKWILSFAVRNRFSSGELDNYDDYYLYITRDATALNQWYQMRKPVLSEEE